MSPDSTLPVAPPTASLAHARIVRGHPWRDGALAGLLAAAITVATTLAMRDAEMRQFEVEIVRGMQKVAAAAATLIDVDQLLTFTAPEQTNSPDFERVAAPLRQIRDAMGDVKYLYTVRVVNGQPVFLVDCAPPGDHDGDNRDDQAKVGEVYDDAPPELLRAWRTGAETWTAPYTDAWGTFVTLFRPLRDRTGKLAALIGVDMDLATHQDRIAAVDDAGNDALVLAFCASLAVAVAVAALRRINLRTARERAIVVQELATAKLAAEAANRSKTEFLANMSHEIRTPLTAILGFTDLLQDELRGGETPREWREQLATIQASGQALLSIINDVLDLSKIEAGKLAVELAPCAVESLVREVAATLRPGAEQKGVHLVVAARTPLPVSLQCDAARLRQILLNLIGNALKFTERGTVDVQIGIDDHPAGSWLVVAVQDTGIGMSAATLGRLFGAFEQADTSTTRRFGGTGLGLRISRHLARLLGGDITVQSELGRGSRFELRLPAGNLTSVVRDRAVTGPQAELRAVLEQRLLADARVLIVDDQADNRRLLTAILQRAGATVDAVDSAMAAYAALGAPHTCSYDLALMDMQMPVIDGLTAVRELRTSGHTLPILAVTANAMHGTRERCLEAGCNGYAPKPIDRRQLIVSVREALDATTRAGATPAAATRPEPAAVGDRDATPPS